MEEKIMEDWTLDDKRKIDFIRKCIEEESELKLTYDFCRRFNFSAAGIPFEDVDNFEKEHTEMYHYYLDFYKEQNQHYAEEFGWSEPVLKTLLCNVDIISKSDNELNKEFLGEVKNNTLKLKKEYFPKIFVFTQEWTIWNDNCTESRETAYVKCAPIKYLEETKKEHPDKKNVKTEIKIYDINENIEDYINTALHKEIYNQY